MCNALLQHNEHSQQTKNEMFVSMSHSIIIKNDDISHFRILLFYELWSGNCGKKLARNYWNRYLLLSFLNVKCNYYSNRRSYCECEVMNQISGVAFVSRCHTYNSVFCCSAMFVRILLRGTSIGKIETKLRFIHEEAIRSYP